MKPNTQKLFWLCRRTQLTIDNNNNIEQQLLGVAMELVLSLLLLHDNKKKDMRAC